jgi:hypothetical protein
MNVYTLLREVVSKSGMSEELNRDSLALLEVLERMNAFGTMGSQDVTAHVHNQQWSRVAKERKCTVCGMLDLDQTIPNNERKQHWDPIRNGWFYDE